MYKKSILMHGVGVNDADYKIVIRRGSKGKQVTLWKCPIYSVWADMIKRCYSEKAHARQPTYKDCSVCDEWLTFSNFRKWMITQDWHGKQLDKDILIKGNKVYSPDACVFIHGSINTFLIDRKRFRGEYPLGSHLHRQTGKMCVQCKNPFTKKKDYLGLFSSPGQAYEAWRKRKHEFACRLADMQTDERVAKALRTRYL